MDRARVSASGTESLRIVVALGCIALFAPTLLEVA
ncbi:MAG: hypothetical protein ACJAZN_000001, partial [Planctomycetota bacterium]